MNALRTFLAPVSVATFAERHWERLPLHVARGAPDYFAGVYGIAEVEESLLVGARDLERFALVKAGGAQAPLDAYVVTSPAIRAQATGKPATAHVDPRKVLGLFEQGYTLVIKDAARGSGRLQRWCNRLQRDLGAYVGANVYCTPPGAQGFDVHHDAHDTLTAQIEGDKTWRIYEPVVELPLESQPLHRETAMPALTLHREITLAAGDTLYLPRGYAHEAVAAAGRALHVTFALAPLRSIDVLHAALDLAAESDVGLRRALPLGWNGDPAFAAELAATLAPCLAGIFDDATLSGGTDRALNDLFAASRSEAGGAFDQLAALDDLGSETVLCWNDALPSMLRERPASIDIVLPGKSLTLPTACRSALERLQNGPLRFADLDVPFSTDDRRRFVTALVREGVLLIADR